MIETQLLNAVLTQRDWGALTRHGLASTGCFPDQTDAFRFIESHLAEHGELPSVESTIVATATSKQQPFEAHEAIESVDTLCNRLKERNLKIRLRTSIEKWAKEYATLDGYHLLAAIRSAAEELHRQHLNGKGGANWSTNGQQRYDEYESRKARSYAHSIPALFDEVSVAIGAYERGDVVTFMAFTGRGKSWLGLMSALAANAAGFKVLVESCEMSKQKCQFRLDTLVGGFSNRGLTQGTLDTRVEQQYRDFTSQFSMGGGRADLIVRTPDDWSNGLTLQQLEADIDKTGCDMVVIDQFNLVAFGRNDRDAKTAFSRQLKQMAARKHVVVVVLYQTTGESERSKGADAAGIRELRIPKISDYSETIALVQDSSIVFGFDAVLWKDESTSRYRGKALLGVLKGRDGGEGSETELEWMPNDGIIRPRVATDLF